MEAGQTRQDMAVIAINTSDGHISSIMQSATEAPVDTAEIAYILLDDAEFDALRALGEQVRADGLSPMTDVMWDGSVFVAAPDVRPYVDVTSDVAEIEMPGSATLTFQVLKPDGTDNTAFNGSRIAQIFGRLMKLTFTNGVAVKGFSPIETDYYDLRSNADVRIKTPLRITVVEV